MSIYMTSVLVDDQDKALRFYTDVLGFVKETDIPLGEARWLTVVSPDDPEGPELLLEPDTHPAAGPFKAALAADGTPATSFAVDDVHAEFQRLSWKSTCFAILWAHALCSPAETQDPALRGPASQVLLRAPCRGRNFPTRRRQNRGDEIGRFLLQRSEEQVGEERYGRNESEQHPQRDGQAVAVDPPNPWSCVDPL
jgi:catechol 2,3-dioxygenase-like lactoylglutathione lyase family enzyme